MPLFKKIQLFADTSIFVWKVDETEAFLFANTSLNPHSLHRLNNMKSEAHRKGFLAIRQLLQKANLSDFDLYYDHTGKPFLKNGKHISISHSHHFACIVVSEKNCGIDLELEREKIKMIAPKFSKNEIFLNPDSPSYIQDLTAIWGAKEAVFKIVNKPGISFNDHLCVTQLNLDKNFGQILLDFEDSQQTFDLFIDSFEHFTLVFAY